MSGARKSPGGAPGARPAIGSPIKFASSTSLPGPIRAKVKLTQENVFEGLPLRCCAVIGTHIWGGEKDGTVSIRRLGEPTNVVTSIPHYNSIVAEGHVADEFPWCIFQSGRTAWIGYSSGTIRVYDLEHFHKHSAHDHELREEHLAVKKLESPFLVLATLQEHKGGVYEISSFVGRDGSKKIFSCSNDFTVRAWDASNFQHLHMYDGHNNYVRAVALKDGVLCTASEDHTARVWEVDTARTISVLSGHTQGVRCIAFVYGAVWTGSDDKTIKIWDPATGELKHSLRGNHAAGVIGLIHSGEVVLSASAEGVICVWSAPLEGSSPPALLTQTEYDHTLSGLVMQPPQCQWTDVQPLWSFSNANAGANLVRWQLSIADDTADRTNLIDSLRSALAQRDAKIAALEQDLKEKSSLAQEAKRLQALIGDLDIKEVAWICKNHLAEVLALKDVKAESDKAAGVEKKVLALQKKVAALEEELRKARENEETARKQNHKNWLSAAEEKTKLKRCMEQVERMKAKQSEELEEAHNVSMDMSQELVNMRSEMERMQAEALQRIADAERLAEEAREDLENERQKDDKAGGTPKERTPRAEREPPPAQPLQKSPSKFIGEANSMHQVIDDLEQQNHRLVDEIQALTDKLAVMRDEVAGERGAHGKHQLFELQPQLELDLDSSLTELIVPDRVLRVAEVLPDLLGENCKRHARASIMLRAHDIKMENIRLGLAGDFEPSHHFQEDDLIVAVNGRLVHSRAEFEQALLPLATGATAQVDVISGDGSSAHTLSVPFTDFKAPVFVEQTMLGIEVEEDVPDYLIGSLGQMLLRIARILPGRYAEEPNEVVVGLHVNDLIMSVNGEEVQDKRQFAALAASFKEGDRVSLGLYNEKRSEKRKVEVIVLPHRVEALSGEEIGIELDDAPTDYMLGNVMWHVKIADGLAEKAGITSDDYVLQVMGQYVTGQDDFEQKISSRVHGAKVELLLVSDNSGKKRTVKIDLPLHGTQMREVQTSLGVVVDDEAVMHSVTRHGLRVKTKARSMTGPITTDEYLTAIERIAVVSAEQIQEAIKQFTPGDRVAVELYNNKTGEFRTVKVILGCAGIPASDVEDLRQQCGASQPVWERPKSWTRIVGCVLRPYEQMRREMEALQAEVSRLGGDVEQAVSSDKEHHKQDRSVLAKTRWKDAAKLVMTENKHKQKEAVIAKDLVKADRKLSLLQKDDAMETMRQMRAYEHKVAQLEAQLAAAEAAKEEAYSRVREASDFAQGMADAKGGTPKGWVRKGGNGAVSERSYLSEGGASSASGFDVANRFLSDGKGPGAYIAGNSKHTFHPSPQRGKRGTFWGTYNPEELAAIEAARAAGGPSHSKPKKGLPTQHPDWDCFPWNHWKRQTTSGKEDLSKFKLINGQWIENPTAKQVRSEVIRKQKYSHYAHQLFELKPTLGVTIPDLPTTVVVKPPVAERAVVKQASRKVAESASPEDSVKKPKATPTKSADDDEDTSLSPLFASDNKKEQEFVAFRILGFEAGFNDEQSAAQLYGITTDDYIIGFHKEKLTTKQALFDAIFDLSAGDKVAVDLYNGVTKEQRTVKVILGAENVSHDHVYELRTQCGIDDKWVVWARPVEWDRFEDLFFHPSQQPKITALEGEIEQLKEELEDLKKKFSQLKKENAKHLWHGAARLTEEQNKAQKEKKARMQAIADLENTKKELGRKTSMLGHALDDEHKKHLEDVEAEHHKTVRQHWRDAAKLAAKSAKSGEKVKDALRKQHEAEDYAEQEHDRAERERREKVHQHWMEVRARVLSDQEKKHLQEKLDREMAHFTEDWARQHPHTAENEHGQEMVVEADGRTPVLGPDGKPVLKIGNGQYTSCIKAGKQYTDGSHVFHPGDKRGKRGTFFGTYSPDGQALSNYHSPLSGRRQETSPVRRSPMDGKEPWIPAGEGESKHKMREKQAAVKEYAKEVRRRNSEVSQLGTDGRKPRGAKNGNRGRATSMLTNIDDDAALVDEVDENGIGYGSGEDDDANEYEIVEPEPAPAPAVTSTPPKQKGPGRDAHGNTLERRPTVHEHIASRGWE